MPLFDQVRRVWVCSQYHGIETHVIIHDIFIDDSCDRGKSMSPYRQHSNDRMIVSAYLLR